MLDQLNGAMLAGGIAIAGGALGMGFAGIVLMSVYKQAFREGKKASGKMIAFVGAPMSQVIYGLILFFVVKNGADPGGAINWYAIGAGLGIGAGGYIQGKVAAQAVDTFNTTDEAFGKYMGIIVFPELASIISLVLGILAANTFGQ
ncbi:MAG: hypothetical protein JXR91_10690 [Deltaproteobacteria bacterium]|jgi:V/A-type H+-transporting ATPase subunit K|nr:hypothetical protein [Deltaproteobacteria bacterium]